MADPAGIWQLKAMLLKNVQSCLTESHWLRTGGGTGCLAGRRAGEGWACHSSLQELKGLAVVDTDSVAWGLLTQFLLVAVCLKFIYNQECFLRVTQGTARNVWILFWTSPYLAIFSQYEISSTMIHVPEDLQEVIFNPL